MIQTAAAIPALPRNGFRPKRVDTNAIFETLRYRISTIEYPPGTALKEMDLSEEFKVSRTPIRQALQRLELAGLVQPVVGHGTMVTGIDLPSMRHLLQYRLVLARMLEHFLDTSDLTDALDRLGRAKASHEELARAFSPQGFAQVSHEVRLIISDQISNPFLAQSWIDTYFLASRAWFLCLPFDRDKFLERQAIEISDLIEAFTTADPRQIATTVHDTLQIWIAEIWASIAQGRSAI